MENLKNSSEMATIVETYVIEETASLIYDDKQLQKWNESIEKLGLIGQTKIVKPEKSPIPFLFMNQSLVNIFTALCPRKVDIKNYDVTPIPVEILDLCLLSYREEYFSSVQIWYDDKTKDPACIGITSEFYVYSYSGVPKELVGKTFESEKVAMSEILKINPDFTGTCGWTTDQKHYLLGRWADVKKSFEELKEDAYKRLKESNMVKLMKEIKEKQRQLDDIDINTTLFLNGETSSIEIAF